MKTTNKLCQSYSNNNIKEGNHLLIRTLYKDYDTDQMKITDNQNHNYVTDIYGRKIVRFLPNISGMLSSNEREKKFMKTSIKINSEEKNTIENPRPKTSIGGRFNKNHITTYHKQNTTPFYKKQKKKKKGI